MIWGRRETKPRFTSAASKHAAVVVAKPQHWWAATLLESSRSQHNMGSSAPQTSSHTQCYKNKSSSAPAWKSWADTYKESRPAAPLSVCHLHMRRPGPATGAGWHERPAQTNLQGQGYLAATNFTLFACAPATMYKSPPVCWPLHRVHYKTECQAIHNLMC